MNTPPISQLLQLAFDLSTIKFREIRTAWTTLSLKVFSVAPQISPLTISVQRLGDLDVLLRSIEEETALGSDIGITGDNSNIMMAELWIGAAYEVFRIIKHRAPPELSADVRSIAYDLALIRMPLEKYQVQDDRSLKTPLEFERFPPRQGDEPIIYDGKDPHRSYVVPRERSESGSIRWAVVDLKANRQIWLERLSLSDRMLALLDRWPSS